MHHMTRMNKHLAYSIFNLIIMATLMQSYEQQYSVLTADLTSKIGRLKVGDSDCEQLMKEIRVNFEEANDLLEQMELESHGAATVSRVAAYKAELQRVKDEFRSVTSRSGNSNLDMDEMYDDWEGAAEQHRKLLDNTERLERSGRALSEGYRVVLETEQIGTVVLNELSEQRDTIKKARGRLRETDEQLNRSSRLMNSMMMRVLQEKFAMVLFFMILGVIMCAGLYVYVT